MKGPAKVVNQFDRLPYKDMTIASATDPYFSNVSLLLHGDSLTDSSSSPKIITAYGNAAVSSTQSKFGLSSFYLNGNDFLRFGKDATVNTLAGDFTIECWVYRTAAVGNYDSIFSISTENSGGWNYDDSRNTINGLTINAGSYCINTANLVSYSSSVPLNTWTHVACVRSGSSMAIYLDGVSVASFSSSSTFGSSNCTPAIGVFDKYGGAYRQFWNGYINEFRITNGIARYVSNFTPPTEPFLDQ